MEDAAKDALAARFRAYLDLPPAPEVPASVSAEAPPAPDLFTLLAEVAALKNEVKLESRQVKGALDEFRGLFETLKSAHDRLADEQQRRREHERAAQAREHRDLLLELLELRDRMQAGHASAAGHRPRGLFGRRRVRAFAAAMADGQAMSLRRLDETLARRGVRPLAAVGQPFDPHRMHAAEVESDPARPAGEVIRELRPGFLLHGELLRLAEVVVNRPDAVTAPAPSPTQIETKT
ncbi:nucleotide exchange factor GrpE [uncultured Thiohalocapsa sp.]|uniref:nucleotide exchange factor GrpE n=1 Tax=uncultured Thiohalocapsa sp. TaxID=768990 RepID=UPI0025EA422F|nr:nucleotide exchange factor GrpE [uncultured Thiohalocapsa sp.]